MVIFQRLEKLFDSCCRRELTNEDKYIIFSDTHFGNGSYQDDFYPNSDLFKTVIRDYYLPKNYTLILNGDIEELYKFKLNQIVKTWGEIYEIFNEFSNNQRLIKLFGNHDFELHKNFHSQHSVNLIEAIRLIYKDESIFIYHGHQTAHYLEDYNRFSKWLGRYVLSTIGYKNVAFSVSDTSKFIAEKVAYKFSIQKKIISILGHTHRPLFESLSKADHLKYTLENLISAYCKSTNGIKETLQERIEVHVKELDKLTEQKREYNYRNSIYNDKIVIPCLFNSGSVIGKRGATGLEIKNGRISLIYWFDMAKSRRYLDYDGVKVKQLGSSNYFKAVLKKDSLDKVFARIKFLS